MVVDVLVVEVLALEDVEEDAGTDEEVLVDDEIVELEVDELAGVVVEDEVLEEVEEIVVLEDVEEEVVEDEEVLVDDEIVDELVDVDVEVGREEVVVDDEVLVVVTGRGSTAVATSARALCPTSAVTCTCVKSTHPARPAAGSIVMLGLTVRLAPGASVPNDQA